jgi:hypothetical protein
MLKQKINKKISILLILSSFLFGFGTFHYNDVVLPTIKVIAATLGFGTCGFGNGMFGNNDCVPVVLTLGTPTATTVTPITGVVGSVAPIILMTGSSVPNGTIASFLPQGSTTPILGTIQSGGNFVPNALQIIPLNATVGPSVGVLSVSSPTGILPVNVPTNFTSSTTTVTKLNLKVYLAGNYNDISDLMSTTLKTKNLLPLTQPYNTTGFNYAGTESASTIASDIVDWVLVEIKNPAGVSIQKKAALLKSNGQVVDSITGSVDLSLSNTITTGSYKVIVRHRNHIAIATDTNITLTSGSNTTIDLTRNVNVKGLNQLLVGTNSAAQQVYGMRQSNANSDAFIDSTDQTLLFNSIDTANTYNLKDVNLDGDIDSLDISITRLVLDAGENI